MKRQGHTMWPIDNHPSKRFLKLKGDPMGEKGKKDKGKREEQKKGKQTLKEKRKQKKEKTKSVWES
jgi:hypothetical protein